MPNPVAAIIGGSALTAGSSLLGSNKASSAQRQAADVASQAELEMFYQNREDLAPWRETGANALTQLWDQVQAGPGDYTQSPGYDFRLSEGERAINRAAAARGQFDSGKTGKALVRYGQDYATNDYDNFLQRWYQSLNPLASLANVGQIATTDTAHMGAQVAGQIGQNQMAAGNARASGYINTANAIHGGINSGISNYLLLKRLNQNEDLIG